MASSSSLLSTGATSDRFSTEFAGSEVGRKEVSHTGQMTSCMMLIRQALGVRAWWMDVTDRRMGPVWPA